MSVKCRKRSEGTVERENIRKGVVSNSASLNNATYRTALQEQNPFPPLAILTFQHK